MKGPLAIIQDKLLMKLLLALDKQGGSLTTRRLYREARTYSEHGLAALERAEGLGLIRRSELMKIDGKGQEVRLNSITAKGKEIVRLAKELAI